MNWKIESVRQPILGHAKLLFGAGAHLDATAGPERGHSCPQQRSTGRRALEADESSPSSGLAADRNVRAPVAAWRYALGAGVLLFSIGVFAQSAADLSH